MDYQLLNYKIKHSYTYPEYNGLMQQLSDEGKCTGPELTLDKINFTKLNHFRMNRAAKQFKADQELTSFINNIRNPWEWVVITESWCGDASQNLPIIAKIAELSPNITLRIVLRDEHPEIMNDYLTDGAMAIPKLVCFNATSGEELGTWGPRPYQIKGIMRQFKIDHPDAPHEDFLKELHLAYGRDRGNSIKEEMKKLICNWTENCSEESLQLV